MSTRSPLRMAWTGGLLGLLLALLVFAPASWLATAVSKATQNRVRLVNVTGTVWQGRADLLLTGGDGSRDQTTLPQGLRWRLAPTLTGGVPSLALALTAPCCTPEPLRLTWVAGWSGGQLQLAASRSQWPADLLRGLGTPWNTLRLEGQLLLQTPGMQAQWLDGGLSLQGDLTLDALDLASRLSTLRPLGSYRLTYLGSGERRSATLSLQTLRGDLRLQGSGQWLSGRLRFQGEAQAAPGREAVLSNLMNILGRRQGQRSVFRIG